MNKLNQAHADSIKHLHNNKFDLAVGKWWWYPGQWFLLLTIATITITIATFTHFIPGGLAVFGMLGFWVLWVMAGVAIIINYDDCEKYIWARTSIDSNGMFDNTKGYDQSLSQLLNNHPHLTYKRVSKAIHKLEKKLKNEKQRQEQRISNATTHLAKELKIAATDLQTEKPAESGGEISLVKEQPDPKLLHKAIKASYQ